jgi:phthalate 4,5-dioxygenase reductase subunit
VTPADLHLRLAIEKMMETVMESKTDHDLKMTLQIASITQVAEGVHSFELVSPEAGELPPFDPGSHIGVRVPNGDIRKYSLCNDPAERSRYVIAVKRDANGRGGSMSFTDDARKGDLIETSPPKNAFPLTQDAQSYIFIAGGIGITPILSMIRSFGELPPVPWKLYYFSQSPETTAFLSELRAPRSQPGKVLIHHDYGSRNNSFDLWPVLERPISGAHIYCCGPRGLMDDVRDMSGHWPAGNVHFESFNEGGGVRPDDHPFDVALAKSRKTLEVPVGKSILNVLIENGCDVAYSCESGTCGTCKTGLLEGTADHRDMVLLPEEMDSQIMICVSRAKSPKIVLDL